MASEPAAMLGSRPRWFSNRCCQPGSSVW